VKISLEFSTGEKTNMHFSGTDRRNKKTAALHHYPTESMQLLKRQVFSL